jgi:hypothetical protein
VENVMIQALSDGKYPRKSGNGTLLEICWRDFQNFKEKYNGNVLEFLSQLTIEKEERSRRPELLQIQKQQLDTTKAFLANIDEKRAFNHFLRTFPTCLPYRSR